MYDVKSGYGTWPAVSFSSHSHRHQNRQRRFRTIFCKHISSKNQVIFYSWQCRLNFLCLNLQKYCSLCI